jgi:hypothetical protein
MTPEPVRKAILELNGTPLDDLKSTLAGEIGTRSGVAVKWSSELFHLRLFRANHSGPLRRVSDFVCPHPDCPASIKLEVDAGRVCFSGAQWMHNHPVDITTCRGLSSLSHSQRSEAMNCVRQNMSSAEIHRYGKFVIWPRLLCDLRWNLQSRDPGSEAEDLRTFLCRQPDVDYQIRPDAGNSFSGCYVFYKPAKHSRAGGRILIMDDTACTNHFGLPLFRVVGMNEHGHNQLIAWIFLFNHTAQEFKDFLD